MIFGVCSLHICTVLCQVYTWGNFYMYHTYTQRRTTKTSCLVLFVLCCSAAFVYPTDICVVCQIRAYEVCDSLELTDRPLYGLVRLDVGVIFSLQSHRIPVRFKLQPEAATLWCSPANYRCETDHQVRAVVLPQSLRTLLLSRDQPRSACADISQSRLISPMNSCVQSPGTGGSTCAAASRDIAAPRRIKSIAAALPQQEHCRTTNWSKGLTSGDLTNQASHITRVASHAIIYRRALSDVSRAANKAMPPGQRTL